MIRERRDVGGCFVVKRTIYVSLDLLLSPIRALPPISSERTTIQAKLAAARPHNVSVPGRVKVWAF